MIRLADLVVVKEGVELILILRPLHLPLFSSHLPKRMGNSSPRIEVTSRKEKVILAQVSGLARDKMILSIHLDTTLCNGSEELRSAGHSVRLVDGNLLVDEQTLFTKEEVLQLMVVFHIRSLRLDKQLLYRQILSSVTVKGDQVHLSNEVVVSSHKWTKEIHPLAFDILHRAGLFTAVVLSDEEKTEQLDSATKDAVIKGLRDQVARLSAIRPNEVRLSPSGVLVPKKLPSPTKTATEAGRCIVCEDNKANALMEPCHHHQYCLQCSVQWFHEHDSCPECRAAVVRVSVLY